jgi:hypothetical protein
MPNLQNANQWQEVYDQMHQVTRLSSTSYIPIPPFTVPILLTSHTLMISTDSEEALARWWLGVRVQMLIDVPGSDFGELPTDRINIPVNRGLLVRFPKLSNQYRLRVEVPEWHQTMRLSIWEFMGLDDSEASLDLVVENLQRIEGKVNSLL